MDKDRPIAGGRSCDLITMEIFSDGKPIDDWFEVVSVSVKRELNRVGSAEVVLLDGNAATEDFPVSDSKYFKPGSKIEIKVGRDNDNESVFKGIVVKHGLKLGEDGGPLLRIECRDEAVKLTVGRKNGYFEKKKDSEVIEDLAKRAGLKVDAEASKVKHDELVQRYATDWDFIVSRAEVNGMVVLTNDGTLRVRKPNTSGSPVLALAYGSNLLEFEAEMDARTQWQRVEGEAWDSGQQKLIKESAKSVPVKEPGNVKGSDLAKVAAPKDYKLSHGGQVLPAELKEWTAACMAKSRLAKIVGRAKFEGSVGVKPGEMIRLSGVGERFSGNSYVSAIRHELAGGTWTTEAQIGLPPAWFHEEEEIIDTPAAGLLPAVNGLQIGKVVRLEEDPAGEHRILVKLPIVDDSAQGIWTRLASLDAGKRRGTCFRPEIDDEVVVGFLNGDPRDAIVLGMVHSSKHPAPIEAKDTNDEKGIVTRSGMRVLFDDEKNTTTIDTPAGNRIALDERDKAIVIEDQNKNKVVLEAGGICLTSPRDIKIEAKGGVSIKAAKDVSIEGMNVKAKAKAQLEASGAAGAKVTSSAVAELRGSLVKIN